MRNESISLTKDYFTSLWKIKGFYYKNGFIGWERNKEIVTKITL